MFNVEDEIWFQENYKTFWKESFEKDGFLVVNNLIDEPTTEHYVEIYENLLSSQQAKAHRFDLGSHAGETEIGSENICQLMWPSLYDETLLTRPIFVRLLKVVKAILGNDMEFDFDMLINKFPNSNTPTPWHQDESYWPDLPDKRAMSCWVALNNATVENGCMWFVKGSHLEGTLRPHRRVKEGHRARFTDECSESEGNPVPLLKGSCTLHHGRTLHYTKGNATNNHRRAYILNFRPKEMIKLERNVGFDHGKTK